MKNSSEVDKVKTQHSVAAVDMAVAAVTGNSNVMDMPVAGIDPDPTVLGLDGSDESEVCSNSQYSVPEEACLICGFREHTGDDV